MSVGTPGFIPERLTEARAARRVQSKTALARLLGVSPSTVTRWEDGSNAPDADALSTLADELRVRREYFLRPTYDSDAPVFYRSLASALVRDLTYQEAQMHWLQEVSAVIQHYVDFPEIDIPDVLEGVNYRQLREEDIERIALDLRHHWQVGEGPCIDMVALLERIGCVVGSIEMGTSKLDGLCSWSRSESRPHILLATDKMSFPRRQIDAAHELGHAVLHRYVTAEELQKNLKLIETQAFRFASAFLMPSTTYPHEVTNPSLGTFLALKERWRTSVKAQIKRLKDLEIVPGEYAVSLYKLYSAKGWNRAEPLDQEWPIPEPRMLRDSLIAITDAGIRTKSDLLSLEFTFQAGDIENIANLPAGWFSRVTGQVVKLKEQISDRADFAAGEGVIIPFPKTGD